MYGMYYGKSLSMQPLLRVSRWSGMLIIWIPFGALLFEPGNDLSTAGVPLILYQPRASLIGWLALMIIVSPVMQLLTTLFGAYLTLLGWLGSQKSAVKA